MLIPLVMTEYKVFAHMIKFQVINLVNWIGTSKYIVPEFSQDNIKVLKSTSNILMGSTLTVNCDILCDSHGTKANMNMM